MSLNTFLEKDFSSNSFVLEEIPCKRYGRKTAGYWADYGIAGDG